MSKQKILLTGATGGMGFLGLQELLKHTDKFDIAILVMDTEKDRQKLKDYENRKGLTIHWGDLTNYKDVSECMKNTDIVLHVAALVSPAADYHPKLAMQVNYGSMRNIIQAIEEQGRMGEVKVVSIGTIAETGDRMPPIHWGRVGDPIKPSMYDYYAVSKIAAERLLIESGLKYWVSLRQTGIMGPAMSKIKDAIMFHNCLDNVLEYVSDRDSGRLLGNLCRRDHTGELSQDFWGHIYNIGGGESCRVDTFAMYKELYGAIGFKDLKHVIDPKWYATRNFHGQYYLDSDKLEEHLHFRQDSMQYFYDAYLENLGATAGVSRFICRLPGGQRLMGSIMKKIFLKEARTDHGTVRFIEQGMEEHIDAYWGSKKAWEAIPDDINQFEHFKDWDKAVWIDHGYNEFKPESELELEDMKGAAKFRGGECKSDSMNKGDWKGKLNFTCAFGHDFEASPRLVLEGGHWCPVCERTSWNYAARAKLDPFFAQVWNPLHSSNEKEREYPKEVSELDV
ncbi:NAD(P)-dependent oxidoreductase [Paenibacillus sp. HN-1]|uniref:NAD-dependent epimerase/dehydratase family protein n=1 Tax=Paenibacillus TaxID=44249 RepID=UPI001CA9E1D2|nr:MULTISPECIES: NAD(P)-dependent oxidoreductase [Paenibacillus]MBY9079084.1 NAD(P)-dependent oxidoreductase [Paenibacillus sp. CGMCC 1.18879]MBY9086862.1 NAD(P)-dependent oxidoreductase [Paenibacillus sinensis]